MKKAFLRYSVVALFSLPVLFTSCSKEEPETTGTNNTPEFLAPTAPQNRNSLLEDFTGVRCGYCPDGHDRAKLVEQANPGKFFIMAVHAGPYAAPAAGWANFTTPFGDALVSQAKVSGYPAGTISRIKATDLGVTPQKTDGYAMSRGSWKVAAEKVMTMTSPVNIGAKATFNTSTRELKVQADFYYTADETVTNNINVALLQDKLMSKQSGAPDMNNYEQNHVLRHLLTGQWGENVTTTTKGSKVSKTYTYTVPEDYNGISTSGGGAVVVDNLKVYVFVTRGQTEVLQVISVDVK